MKTFVYYKTVGGEFLQSNTGDERRVDPEREKQGLGPGVSHLVVSSMPNRNGGTYKVVGGNVIVIPNPVEEARRKDRKDGLKKLRQLGLTVGQTKAIFGED